MWMATEITVVVAAVAAVAAEDCAMKEEIIYFIT